MLIPIFLGRVTVESKYVQDVSLMCDESSQSGFDVVITMVSSKEFIREFDDYEDARDYYNNFLQLMADAEEVI